MMDATDHSNPLNLIQAAQHGDQAAYQSLYDLYVEQLYRLAYGVLLDALDAEEVVQDSLGYAFRSLSQFDPALSSFRSWLYTITISRCRNKRRRKWLPTFNLTTVVESLASGEPRPETLVERQGTQDAVLQAMGRLSPKLREAVAIRYFDGLTYREMGDVLGCSQKTAESRIRLAHEALFKILTEELDVLPENLLSYEQTR
ncbi:MAG: sigma-70 family RNA polymerase sigma factor [Chloroflexi bacterium]|nr:sigma-70 family RNA polymerase sigma factor [Chloroflexota bacterium]